jgi:AGCS family alanine or glycine:cation symporter
VLAIAVILFAFSTIIAYSYYMVKASTYLFGESPKIELALRVIFCCFTVIGATMQLGPVIDFSDAMFFSMAIFNIIGLYIMAPEIKQDLDSYWSRLKGGGIRPYKEVQAEAAAD